jgi:hypothetical protein
MYLHEYPMQTNTVCRVRITDISIPGWPYSLFGVVLHHCSQLRARAGKIQAF